MNKGTIAIAVSCCTHAISRQIKLAVVIVEEHRPSLLQRRTHFRFLLHLKIMVVSVSSHLVDIHIYQDIIANFILN